MAILHIGNTISGTASDRAGMTDPTANELGLLFVETDTDKIYQWDGDSWEITTASDATASAKGVASFDSDDFSVSSGAVSLASGLSLAGTTTISNLNVTGTTTTANSTNTTIGDKLIELANGTTGTPSGDAGIVIERGSSANAIMAWDEDEDRFIFGTTSATGASSGDLTITLGTVNANIVGSVTGNASTATTSTNITAANNTTTADQFVAFLDNSSTAAQQVLYNTGITFNPGTNNLATTTFTGALTGTADVATAVTLYGSGNVTYYPTFVDATSGNENMRVDSDWTYNASTNKMTVGNIAVSTTIGHTNDVDLLTLTSGNLAIAGTTTTTGAITVAQTAAPHYDFSGNWTVANHSNPYIANVSGVGMTLGTYKFNIITNAGNSTGVDFAIDENGKVGIGTASPAVPLHVHGGSNSGSMYISTDSAPAGTNYAGLWLATDLDGSDDWAGLIFDRGNDNLLRLVNAGDSNSTLGIIIDATGQVGIGTSTPQTLLDVAGASIPTIAITNTDTSVTDGQIGGTLRYFWSDSSTSSTGLGAEIRSIAEQTYSGNQRNTRLEFRTTLNTTTTTQMVIDKDGNIGIGTTSPDALLELETATTSGTILRLKSTATDSYPTIRFINDQREWRIYGADGSQGDRFVIHDASTAARFVIDAHAKGRIGMGTVTPFQNVAGGTIDLDVSGLHIKDASAHGQIVLEGNPPSLHVMDLGGGSNDKWMMYRIDGGRGWFQSLNDDGSTRSADILSMDLGTGNVGIGVSDPDADLEVAGQVKITGGSPGADKVLTSDANGLATWAAAAGGGGSATLTVANGQTVTQGKGVAVNPSGEAIPYNWGSHRKPTVQYAELNPAIQGIDGADSNWSENSDQTHQICMYDGNINKYIMFFKYKSGRAVRSVLSGSQWQDTGTYPNVSSADGDKPINTLLGSGNEIDKQYTWITCVGTMNNSTGAITWSGYQKVPILDQPDTAYTTHNRAAGAHVDLGNGIWYNQNGTATGNYALGTWLICYTLQPAGSGTNTGANQKRRLVITAKYNNSTGKLDFSSTSDLDGTGTNPNQYLTDFFAGFVGDQHILLTKQPTSTSTAVQFYVQELNSASATWSGPQAALASSTGSTVTPMNTGRYGGWGVWNPSNDKIMIYIYSPQDNYAYGKQYTRSSLTLSTTNDTTLYNTGIAYSYPSGHQVVKHNSGTGAGDGCFYMQAGWYGGYGQFNFHQMKNGSGSDTYDKPSYNYTVGGFGSSSNIHYSNTGGWSYVNGQPMDIYTTDNSGDGALGMGQMFRYGGSRALQLSAGAKFYTVQYGGASDASLGYLVRSYTLRYDGWGGEGTTIQAQFGPSQNSQTGYGDEVHTLPATAHYKFEIGYGQYSSTFSHWNPDYQGFVNFIEYYTPAVYKDNDNGTYTANSAKAYFANQLNVETIKAGNANLETTINWGGDPGPFVGLAKTTVTGNGSNTVDINIVGSVDENQSGLLPGTTYYMNHEGTAIPGVPFDSIVDINIGTAISATKLIVANANNTSGMTTSSSTSDLLLDD